MTEKENALKTADELAAAKIISNLKSRRFDAYYCADGAEAAEKALSLIPEGSTVSWGGSMTLREIGLTDKIYRSGLTVIDRDKGGTPAERTELMRRSLLCDVYLTSFNAVSEDGVLYNIDSGGNRAAAVIFGPKSVVAVVGMNKISKTAGAAKARARTVAAPMNVRRLSASFGRGFDTPCAQTGACENCLSDDCICSHIVETRFCRPQGRIKIILVGKPLGF